MEKQRNHTRQAFCTIPSGPYTNSFDFLEYAMKLD